MPLRELPVRQEVRRVLRAVSVPKGVSNILVAIKTVVESLLFLLKVLGYLSTDECEVAARNISKKVELKPA